ncbi:hypothetical protein EBU58_15695 [bacterium]|nr:hypothetical protein [bacterium]
MQWTGITVFLCLATATAKTLQMSVRIDRSRETDHHQPHGRHALIQKAYFFMVDGVAGRAIAMPGNCNTLETEVNDRRSLCRCIRNPPPRNIAQNP